MKKQYFKNKKSKYNNTKILYDGIKFDSKKERDYYISLVALKKFKKIIDFQLQVKYELLPSQKDPDTGKVIERPTSYYADFVVNNIDGSTDVIDVKAFDKKTQKFISTEAYKIKKKLMLYFHGIRIVER